MIVKINDRIINKKEPVYFIADIASNHNGDLVHAKELIHACSESRVDAVKMQNFNADTIVSDYGFKNLSDVQTHQSKWKTSVYDSYKSASIPFEWTLELNELANKLELDYFTSPYSIEITKAVSPYVSAFKLGSGDITWHDELKEMSKYNKPIIIATGASNLSEIKMAMMVCMENNSEVILMQCNTNYTAKKNEDIELTKERYSNINLKVLETFEQLWPKVPLGLSDHTHGDLTVLAAVGLYNCCTVEKHFTLDNTKNGQDHSFSMMPDEWLSMVNNTEQLKALINVEDSFLDRYEKVKEHTIQADYLELVIGDGNKIVAENEKNTVIVQRRAIRAKRNLMQGDILSEKDLTVLRPCPIDGFPPYQLHDILGKTLKQDVTNGDYIKLSYLEI
ncbi:MAG: N-acetylneuraminate synthase family protein [Methylococcaceae bacterium]